MKSLDEPKIANALASEAVETLGPAAHALFHYVVDTYHVDVVDWHQFSPGYVTTTTAHKVKTHQAHQDGLVYIIFLSVRDQAPRKNSIYFSDTCVIVNGLRIGFEEPDSMMRLDAELVKSGLLPDVSEGLQPTPQVSDDATLSISFASQTSQ